MRVRRPSRFSNRIFRACALVRSAGEMARLWWTMSWHEKMWLVWVVENTSPDEWPGFGAKAALGIRRAWVAQMTKPAVPRVDLLNPNAEPSGDDLGALMRDFSETVKARKQVWTHVVRKRNGRLLVERLESGEVVYTLPEHVVVHSRRPLWDLAGRLDAGADPVTAITEFEASMSARRGE